METIFLVLLNFAFNIFSSPPLPGLSIFPFLHPSHFDGKNHLKGLAKTTATSDLKWMKTGSKHYYPFSIDTAWSLSSRDTTIYDPDGNLVVSKTSNAKSGWASDSLSSLDSAMYVGGILTEYIQEPLNISGYFSGGQKHSYEYINGGKTLVATDYFWNDSKKTWIPFLKDSLLFSTANTSWPLFVNNFLTDFDYSSLLEINGYTFDTIASVWKILEHDTKYVAECNDTTLTFIGKGQLDNSSDSLIDEKIIIQFRSRIMTQTNATQSRIQRKNPLTETYYDYSQSSYTYDINGYPTSIASLNWDTTANAMTYSARLLYFPDSHGNDTLEIGYYYYSNPIPLDTIYNRYTRSYDANGNNLETIRYYHNQTGNPWSVYSKDVNSFAQINSAVLQTLHPAVKQGISVITTASRIVIKAQDITGLKLYDVAGKLVASVNQQKSNLIGLDLRTNRIPTGVYVAKIMSGEEQYPVRLSIQR